MDFKRVAATLGANHLAANTTTVDDILRQSVIPDTSTLNRLLHARSTFATLAQPFAPLDKPSTPTILGSMAQLSTQLQLLVNYLQHSDLKEPYSGVLEFGALEDVLKQLHLSTAILYAQQLLAALNTTEQL